MKKKPSVKKKAPLVDGMSPNNRAQVAMAVRRVWWASKPRRLCINRAIIDGLYRCEKCKQQTIKICVDHIEPVGDLLSNGAIERLFCPSRKLMALCKECHAIKTKAERKAKNAVV